jgi:hypothetical protein
MTLANTSFYLGDMRSALLHVKHGLAASEPIRPEAGGSPVFTIGQNPIVSLEFCGALVNWLHGNSTKAEQHCKRGLAFARELTPPFKLVMAHTWSGILNHFAGRVDQVSSAAANVMDLSQKHNMPGCYGIGCALARWAKAIAGLHEEGIILIREGRQTFERTGDDTFDLYTLGLLADTHGQAEKPQEGLTTIVKALAVVEQSGVRWDEPRLLQVEAVLEAQVSNLAAAEIGFGASIASAVELAMPALDVSSSVLLGRPLHDSGRSGDAREVLNDCLARLHDDVDIPQLAELRMFLATLTSTPESRK